MPSNNQIVINTSPLIALVAAVGDLKILESLYTDVLVPFEVYEEILIGGTTGLAVNEFKSASWLQKQTAQ
ncbi:hypothetical protein [Nostoc sp. KVJ3]|uniref:hypothetical protein n=1 Tax=Nostoc sp. KVJ3 TaxID=457945 RepID=UPI0022376EBF|nr:hypothetical protein [Nostoc sp. KVJ3]